MACNKIMKVSPYHQTRFAISLILLGVMNNQNNVLDAKNLLVCYEAVCLHIFVPR